METLTSPLPALPFDLVVEILYRLQVKFLLQFRSVCKLWNSLISDSKFTNKHLSLSTTYRINSIRYSYYLRRNIFESYPLDSIFSTICPNGFDMDRAYSIVGSCNGILCLAYFKNDCFVHLWNPSIRKFKELPIPEKPKMSRLISISYGFGYDHVNDNYMVVVVFRYFVSLLYKKTEVMVHTLGTDFWKNVQEFPFGCVPVGRSGTFVSGTINWLPFKDGRVLPFIVSFNLTSESYRQILPPDYQKFEPDVLILGVLRDCLCLICLHDVWIMKEYGNKESWTKLFTNSDKSYYLTNAIYMFANDKVLFETSHGGTKMFVVHDPKFGTIRFVNLQSKSALNLSDCTLVVCRESLLSPWSVSQEVEY